MKGRISELTEKIRDHRRDADNHTTELHCAENELDLLLRADCSAYDKICKRIEELEIKNKTSSLFTEYWTARNAVRECRDDLRKWLLSGQP